MSGSYRGRGFRLTCIYLDPDIYIALRLRAIRENKDMSEIVNDALKRYLAESDRLSNQTSGQQDTSRLISWSTSNSQGVMRGGGNE
ncbi:hypothetical protein [Caldivirga sp.]|uniref:hypothetical protein n=1 Tax=Caldivirga sp. TaxID=2080243 RepID=UPI0025C318BF|nr:hypothetical protein [Caldivirga sp.]